MGPMIIGPEPECHVIGDDRYATADRDYWALQALGYFDPGRISQCESMSDLAFDSDSTAQRHRDWQSLAPLLPARAAAVLERSTLT